MSESKPEVILRVVYINPEKTAKDVAQARRVVDAALEMLKVSRYPIDQIRVKFE